MTIKELIKELKQYPSDAHVFINPDWDATDEEGYYTKLEEIQATCEEVVVIDMGMDFEDVHHVILSE